MSAVLASILGIGFWAIAAVAIVALCSFVYVEVQYYQWNKQEREHGQLVEELSKRIAEKVEEVKESSPDEN